MDWLLFLSIIFVLAFLITIAAFYITRPSWIIIDDGLNTPEVDMWRTFDIALLVALLFVLTIFFFAWKHYELYGYGSLVNLVRLGCPPKPAKKCPSNS